MHRRVLALTVACYTLSGSTALAAERGASSEEADSLFEDGRGRFAEGDFEAACRLFEESLALEPAPGTRYHLAECHIRTGHLLQAIGELEEVARASRAGGRPERADHADRRRREISIDVPEITIDVADQVADVTVELDGALVVQDRWGGAIPLDPGVHTVRASAPLHETRIQRFTIKTGEQRRLQVPALVPDVAASPSAESVAARSPDTSDDGDTQGVAGGILAGTGVLAIGAGTALGIHAIAKHDASLEACRADAPNLCSAEGVALRDEARSVGTWSTIAIGVGAAAVAGGAVLWLTSSGEDDEPEATRAGVAVNGDGIGLRIGGAFE